MTLLSGSGGTKVTRLGKHQKFSLDYVCKQVFLFKHRNSYIETSKGWGKPHQGRVIASLVERGLITCWHDSLFEVKLSPGMIPNEGAFFAMPTKLGHWFWNTQMSEVSKYYTLLEKTGPKTHPLRGSSNPYKGDSL